MTISSETKLHLSLPIIDFSSPYLKPETPEWDLVRSQVRKALEEYGCFEAFYDGASLELRKALFEASKEVFDLPLETKMSTRTNIHYEGYLPFPSVQEGIGFYGVDNPNVVNDLTNKRWPQGNNFVRKNVETFGEKLIELSLKVRSMTMESFGLEKYMEDHLSSANKHLQLLKYKRLPDDNTKSSEVGFYPHIDRHFLTILCQSDDDAVDGLEIKTKDGEDWIKVKPSQASSFIVMAGASLHITISSETKLPLSLPIIDFSSPDLKPETPEWDLVRSQVRKALEEYGCFEALFDGASMELRKALFAASKEVFDLPLETKMSTRTNIHYEGYLPIPSVPLQEGIGFYGVDNPNVVNDLTNKLWPQGNNFVRKNVETFAEKLIELNLKVRTMTMESFGLEKYMEDRLSSANKHFQLLKYKGLPDDNTKSSEVGFYPHIDRHFLTILCQNDDDAVDGLEIKTKDGQEWIKVKPSQASSFIVMAGASLHVQDHDYRRILAVS